MQINLLLFVVFKSVSWSMKTKKKVMESSSFIASSCGHVIKSGGGGGLTGKIE